MTVKLTKMGAGTTPKNSRAATSTGKVDSTAVGKQVSAWIGSQSQHVQCISIHIASFWHGCHLPISRVLVETGVTTFLKMPVQQSESDAADRAIARNIVLCDVDCINASETLTFFTVPHCCLRRWTLMQQPGSLKTPE
jgi:hypothetical protein